MLETPFTDHISIVLGVLFGLAVAALYSVTITEIGH